MSDSEKIINDLQAEIERLRGELERSKEREQNIDETRRAMLYMLEDLNSETGKREAVFEKLKESEKKFRTLIANIPGMIYRGMPDWSTEIVYGSENICGYTPEEFNSKRINWANIIVLDDREKVFMEAPENIKRKMSIVQEYRIVAKDGGIRWVEDHKTSIFSDKGVFEGVDGVVFDNTEKKRLEQEMIRQEKLAGMGQLAAGVAHELKNPLNIISGYMQMLDMEEKEAEKKEMYKIVLQQVDRSVKIINNLLDFARRREHEIKDVDINNLLEKTVQLVEYEMKTENIIFIKDFDKDLTFVKCDSDQLAQVFLNLINNSRHAMNEKQRMIKSGELKIEGWKGEIRITTKKKDDMAEIIIADTGTGIPEDKATDVFKPFFTTKAEKGTGLGLSVAKEIIESHGGHIELENMAGEGVKFIIRFKL